MIEEERDERALEALRDHEKECALRYERMEGRFTRIETRQDSLHKMAWAILTLTVLTFAKEILAPVQGLLT